MSTFQDRKGREWMVSVNVGTIKRVRDVLGVNLGTVLQDDMKPLADLVSDPVAIVDCLYVICKPQADERSVSDVDFGESLCGDSFEAASNAFLEGLIDFFPSRQARMLTKLVEKGQTIQTVLAAAAEKELDAINESTVIERLSSLQES